MPYSTSVVKHLRLTRPISSTPLFFLSLILFAPFFFVYGFLRVFLCVCCLFLTMSISIVRTTPH